MAGFNIGEPIPGDLWPVADFDEAQVREVYARFGLAMYTAQVLEHGMVNALLVLRLLPSMRDYADQTSWDAAFDHFYDSELAKTFGNIVRGLQQVETFSADLIERLHVAKRHRDHLAHSFFRTHDTDFLTRPGRANMISECEAFIDLFQEVDGELEAIVAPQRARFGITTERIESYVAQMENEARETSTVPPAD